MRSYLPAKMRWVAVSSIAAVVMTISNPLLAAGSARPAPLLLASAGPAGGNSGYAVVDARIRNLHDQLKITPSQESQWRSVAQVMMSNASGMNDAVQSRERILGRMTAVDDLLSYQAIVAAHADGLRKLAAVFAPLYRAMPPAQKRNADAIFGHRTDARLREHN